ncbi:hypothetical protein [Tenacibaculum ovolyticum]|uniref:hypothetical protein n=1 Tax=Tenacibaculum ovolyticum TaxID=104270 RepID=UPI0007ED41AE|nr:hypothetical protein [Tenacibaculum ovolyticum]
MLRVKKIKQIIVLLCLVSFSSIKAQSDVKKILESYKVAVENDTEYQVNLTYKVYKGHSERIPIEVQKGILYKKGNNSYTKLSDVEMINTVNTYLKINHNEKAVLIADGVQKPEGLNLKLDELYKYVNAKIINENPKTWVIKLTPKGKVTQLPFSSLIIELSKGTYRVKKQLFYYLTQMDFSEDLRKTDVANVKLEVLFGKYNTSNLGYLSDVFTIKKYIKKEKDVFKPLGSIRKYEVVNMKTNKKL